MLIDKNVFESEELGHYLSEDVDNFAIISDFALLESYTGNPVINFNSSFTILRKFIPQFVLMKRNSELSNLDLSNRQRSNLIDWVATEKLREIMSGLNKGGVIDTRSLEENCKIAKEKLDEIASGVESSRAGLEEQREEVMRFSTGFDGNGMPVFGKRGLEKIKSLAYDLSLQLCGDKGKRLSDTELIQTFAYRFALSAVSTMVIRYSRGAVSELSIHKLRNDVIDNNYIACATYWDGLMTLDDNPKLAYRFLTDVLKIRG